MKPISEKRFYFTITEKLYWSTAFQSLSLSARNLMMCLYVELRWTKKKKKKIYTNNGQISFSEAEFKSNGLGASQTYLNARNQLIGVGLIELTYRGGMARGDMNRYKLLWVEGVSINEKRWLRYPKENWKKEIPNIKSNTVGKSTRFKKKSNTLTSHTHNNTHLPNKLDPYLSIPPNEVGDND